MLNLKFKLTIASISAAILMSGCAMTNSHQSNQLTTSDYEQAERQLTNFTRELIYNTVETERWLDNSTLLYRTSVKGGHQFVIADANKGNKSAAFDHQAIAKALSTDKETYTAITLPFKSVRFNKQTTEITFTVNQQVMSCHINSFKCKNVNSLYVNRGHVLSPDGKKSAFIKNNNLWVRQVGSGTETRLTKDGQHNFGYGTNNAGWLRSKTPVMLWSPDSKKIATFQQDSRLVKSMHLTSTNVGHPKLDSWKYPLPGDKHVFMLERVVIDVESKQITRIKDKADYQRSTITDHIYSDGKMLDVQWNKASDSLAYVSVSRDHSHATLKVADVKTGQVVSILDEKVATFFESGTGKANWFFLPKTNEVIWFSQRSDWGHLYLYDLGTGTLKKAITEGDWNVLQVRSIDEKLREIYFTGAGREGGDPYFKYFYKVKMDGSALTLLTPEIADHTTVLSDNNQYFSDKYSTPNQPSKAVVRNNQGEVVVELENTDINELTATNWRAPEAFVVKDRNGKFDIHGLMYKPSNFDSSKSYPIINYLYPGPQTGSIGSRSFRASRGDKQAMAELGFILIEIDALGTPMRSKSFHEFYYGNMGDSGIPDQISAIKQLASQYSFIDTNRVGIWGHSGGGFASTHAILTYPDFYKVAVSSAGNHDNRNYADPWGEKWQGLVKKNKDGTTNYDNQANQLIVDGLKGKLLLAHGTLDDNVPPFNTLIVVNALIKANKDFDLLMLPNRRHGFSREPYMMRKRWDYFVTHLMGKTPPKEFEFGKQ